MMDTNKCPDCKGRGYWESPHLWDGRAECNTCGGLGIKDDAICNHDGHTLAEHVEESTPWQIECDFTQAGSSMAEHADDNRTAEGSSPSPPTKIAGRDVV